MFSMIVELNSTVSFQDENIERLGSTYQRTLFPAPAISDENHQFLRKRRNQSTHVSHESIKGSLIRTISTPRACCLRQTMLPFRSVASHRQYGDFSTDQVERANSEFLAVSCHLRDDLSDSSQQCRLPETSYVCIC